MKNFVAAIIIALSLSACKKDENSNLNTSEMNSDSLSVNQDLIDNTEKALPNYKDSVQTIAKDTAVVKIQILKEQKQLLTEKVAKTMDSAARSEIISEIKITQNKIDSVKNKLVSAVKKPSTTPKVLTKTKIVYRDLPKKEIVQKPVISKTAEVQIMVNDLKMAQDLSKEQINKYDGTIKSEQNLLEDHTQYTYLKISLPLDKSNYLIEDLEDNVGKIIASNIEMTGSDYSKNAICEMEITLVNNKEKSASSGISNSFGGRTLGAVGSGWNVIQEIFLFVLPFWPLFLIGGAIFYFLKKKKTENA